MLGKILIIFIVFTTVCLQAGVSMTVRTENGQQNQVVVGQPFTLEVTIDDVYGSVQAPKIKGLDKFTARQSGSYMSSINGKSKARYSYEVCIDEVGSYDLGPVTVRHQQQELVSNVVHIDVVKDMGMQVARNKNQQIIGSKVFLRFMTDSESVVVGQKIGCVLRFYYQDQSLSLHNINMPELSGFDVKEISKLEAGTAEIDGELYKYAQWRWDMYPTKAGEFVIPAYNADYDIPLKDNNHVLGGLFMLINNRVDRKRVYSNALTIKVLPLPPTDQAVQAVGVFERISADIKPGIAKIGEGMVLVVEIEGTGNLDSIAIPSLKMPDVLKYYDSNHAIIAPQNNDELPKKRFEFIVQGLQPGACEIPEQTFTYFDIERNAYVTLRTSPIAVSIMPGVFKVKQEDTIVSSPVDETVLSCGPEEEIASVNSTGPWYPVSEKVSLPWWIFHLLLFAPCAYLGFPLIVGKCIFLTGNSSRLARRRAFKHAYKKLAGAKEVHDIQSLYKIFICLFQELEQISGKTCIISSPEWNDFFERITFIAYGQCDNENVDELYRMAKQWIERLEKTI